MAGNVPITGYISPTDPINDDYATQDEEFNRGGYRSVANSAIRDAISVDRRKEGMEVRTLDTGELWILASDLTTWVLDVPPVAGAITLIGDVTGSGASPITTTLATVATAGSKGTAARSAVVTINVKGLTTTLTDTPIQITEAQVTNLVADLALKADTTALALKADLVAGTVPLAQLPFAATAYQGTWDASTNTPVLADGVGAAGDFYWIVVQANRNLGSGVKTWLLGYGAVYDGAIWQVGTSISPATIQNIITDSGTLNGATVTLNSTAQIADNAGRRYVTDNIQAGLLAAVTPITGANPAVSQADLNFSIFTYQNSWNAATNTPVLVDGVGVAGDAYIVGVAGTQNLGSGAIIFAKGDLVILSAGLIWQQITIGFVGVSSWNGLAGVVNVTTANLPDSANKRYVLDAYLAAMAAANAPSGANAFATMADIVFAPLNYIGGWNASSNAPALADGAGTAGDTYTVSTGAVRNLGSGAITWAVGSLVIYNGAVWQQIPISTGVTSWNGLTGALTVTTTNLPDSSGFRYQTDLQRDMQNAEVVAGGSVANRRALLSDLGSIVVGTEWLTPESIAVGYTLGNGTAQTGASYGKSNAQFQADFPLVPGLTNADLVDYAALYQSFALMNSTNRQNEVQLGCFGARDYIINKKLVPPIGTAKSVPQRYNIVGHGCLIRTTSTTQDIFHTMPADQADTSNTVQCPIRISGLTLSAINSTTKGSGQAGIRIGGRDVVLHDILLSGFDTTVDLQFCLNAELDKLSATNYETTGFHLGSGTWSGASLTNSQCNGSVFRECRANATPFQDYGFHIESSSDITMFSCDVEGDMGGQPLANAPKAAVFFDTLGITNVRGTFQIYGLYLEQFFATAAIWIKCREGIHSFSDVSNQNQGLDPVLCRNLIRHEGYVGISYSNLIRFNHWTSNLQFYMQSASTIPIFDRCWSATAANLNTPTRWSNFQPSLATLQGGLFNP